MKLMFAIAPFIILTACEMATPLPDRIPPVPAPGADTCGAAEYAALVGQDATALERVLIMGEVRVIRPGQAVTMDFRPSRINFQVGLANTITSITCQ